MAQPLALVGSRVAELLAQPLALVGSRVAELLAQPLALVGSRGWFAGAFWGKLHRKPRLRLLP